MDYINLLAPLLLVILCVQIGIITIKLDAIISILKSRE